MYESKVLKLKEVPVFSLADVSQIVSGKEYAKKLLRRLVSSQEINRIKKNAYTFYEDPLLVSTFLVKPSYVSSVSALSYHKLITQIPKTVFCFTTKQSKKIKFISEIQFIHTNYFFGFESKEYYGFKIPMATPEKAILDSFGMVPVSVFEESIEAINVDQMLYYLKKISKSDIIKRAGFLLESHGFRIFDKVKGYINNRYINYDPLAKKNGIKDKKWRLILNTK